MSLPNWLTKIKKSTNKNPHTATTAIFKSFSLDTQILGERVQPAMTTTNESNVGFDCYL